MAPGPGDKMILVEEGGQTLCPTAVSEHVINRNNRVKGVCGVLRADILGLQGRKLEISLKISLKFPYSLKKELPPLVFVPVVSVFPFVTERGRRAFTCD